MTSKGHWSVKVRLDRSKQEDYSVNALTIIDPATNLVEIGRQMTKESVETADLIQNLWLSRYPRPLVCVTDGGPEFQGATKAMLQQAGIKHKMGSAGVPTSNAYIEAIHKPIGQVLRTLLHWEQPFASRRDADVAINNALHTAMHVCRAASNGTLGGHSAGVLAFGRDMHLNLPIIVDKLRVAEQRQLMADKRLTTAMARRIAKDYKVGDWVYLKANDSYKLQERWIGPFQISRVHTNGTVSYHRRNLDERMSIRRLKPAKAPT